MEAPLILNEDSLFFFYRCVPQRIIDGDTVVLKIDLGLNVSVTEPCRLKGINAPEIRGLERPEGLESKAFLEWLLDGPSDFACQTYKDRTGKYGRYLVDLYADEVCVNEAMVAEGYAEEIE